MGNYPTRRTLPPWIATQIRAARNALGIGLEAAAAIIGIDKGYQSRIERGHRCPRPDVAEAIIVVFDLDPATARQLRNEAGQTAPQRTRR